MTAKRTLLDDFRALLAAPHDDAAARLLRDRALAEGEQRIAALCLQRVAYFEKAPRARVRLYRQLVRELPVSSSFSALGFAERDLGHLGAARAALAMAVATLQPEAPAARRDFLMAALREVEAAVAGAPGAARRRIAWSRCAYAVARARTGDARREWRLLQRHLREQRRRGDTALVLVYLDGLVKLAELRKDRRGYLRFIRELALEEDTPSGLQGAALAFEAAGRLEDALALLERAVKRAETDGTERREQLELKLAAVRTLVRESRRTSSNVSRRRADE